MVEWPLALSRTRDGNPSDALRVALDSLRNYEENLPDEGGFEAPKTAQFRDSVWKKWNEFIDAIGQDSTDIWLRLCLGNEESRKFCGAFLEWYVRTSKVLRPCLGKKEWEEVRTIRCAVTVEDVWAAVVKRADEVVLKAHRLSLPPNEAAVFSLNFSSRRTTRSGPAYEISKTIPGLARRLGLSLEQTFEKKEFSDGDIVFLLTTLWAKGNHIRCNPDTRVAFHTVVVASGVVGSRPASFLSLKYEKATFALVRDPADSKRTLLFCTLIIHHVKEKENTIHRDQHHVFEFSFTFTPCKRICLLTLLLTRALKDNAFQAGYTSIEQVLSGEPLEAGTEYVPLHWKASMLDKPIIPLSYNSYWRIWRRTLFVAGVRDENGARPYALRVGAGRRLDGSLTRALSNYVMGHSTAVFEKSYQPRHISKDLMEIAFQSRAGSNGDIVKTLSSVFTSRDDNAPIYLAAEELDAFEKRKDITILRQLYRDTVDPKQAQAVKARIKYLIDFLEGLQLKANRREYFQAVDHLRATRQSTEHLWSKDQKSARKQRVLPGLEKAAAVSNLFESDYGTLPTANAILAYLKDDEVAGAAVLRRKDSVKCLLCSASVSTRSSLSRHVSRWHKFEAPTYCPACDGCGRKMLVEDAFAWAIHVEKFHGKHHVPNPKIAVKPAYCPLCSRYFSRRGFQLHFTRAHSGKLQYPFKCPECKRKSGLGSSIANFDAWVLHIRNAHSGGNLPGAIVKGSEERLCQSETRDDEVMTDCDSENKGALDLHADEEFWVTGIDSLDTDYK